MLDNQPKHAMNQRNGEGAEEKDQHNLSCLTRLCVGAKISFASDSLSKEFLDLILAGCPSECITLVNSIL